MSDYIKNDRLCYDYLLPEEILVEILLRLPTKCLIRFKSICKSWCNLISSPQFLVKHLLPSHDNDYLLVKYRNHTTKDHVFSLLSNRNLSHHSLTQPLPYPDLPTSISADIKVLGRCNGFICLFDTEHYYVVLWNPTDGEYKVLPESPYSSQYDIMYPSIAFGYDASSDDYMVLRIGTLEIEDVSPGKNELFEIYSYKTDSWRILDIELSTGVGDHLPVAYFHGLFLWWGHMELVWFRMSESLFGTIAHPDEIVQNLTYSLNLGHPLTEDDPHFDTKMFIMNGQNVAVVVYDLRLGLTEKCFHVWVLLEFGVQASWTKLVTTKPFRRIHQPLWFWKYGKIIMENNDAHLILCDPFTNEIESLDIGGVSETFDIVSLQKYMGSGN